MVLWDVEAGKAVSEWKTSAHIQVIESLSISADGRFALTGSEQGILQLWDLKTGEVLRDMTIFP